MSTNDQHSQPPDECWGYDCIDAVVGELLPLFSEKLLGREQQRLFEAHLEACHRCSEDHRAMQLLTEAIHTLPAAGLTPARRSGSLFRPVSVSGRSALVAASALLAVGIGIWWQRGNDAAVASRVRELEGRLARLETQSQSTRRIDGEQGEEKGVVSAIGFAFPTPPNL